MLANFIVRQEDQESAMKSYAQPKRTNKTKWLEFEIVFNFFDIQINDRKPTVQQITFRGKSHPLAFRASHIQTLHVCHHKNSTESMILTGVFNITKKVLFPVYALSDFSLCRLRSCVCQLHGNSLKMTCRSCKLPEYHDASSD